MIHWPTLLFIAIYHLLFFIGLPLYLLDRTPSTALLVWSFALMFISGLGVTAGYHRLMAHTTYKTNRWVEAVLLFFASVAVQGSALRWCYDHRLHHAYVDTDRDPYSIKKGFWYAHLLWMFRASRPIESKVVSDLLRSPLIRYQHDNYVKCMVGSNLFVYLVTGFLFADWWGALVFATLGRLFTLHHLTWFINSLAHMWGAQNYSREHSAVDSYILCLLTFGEGYHNYHHTFPYDFRNGIRWYHFDPTKWLIWTLSKFKLAWGLKKVDNVLIAKQLLQDHRRHLFDGLHQSFYEQKELLETTAKEIQEALVNRLTRLNGLIEQSKLAQRGSEQLSEIAAEMRETKRAVREDWRRWKQLVRSLEKAPETA